MSKYLIGAAAAALMMVGAGGVAQANECGLNDQQISNGWTCTLEETVGDPVTTFERAGNSHMCKVFESSTIISQWVARNPAQVVNDAHSTDPVIEETDAVKVGGNVVCPE